MHATCSHEQEERNNTQGKQRRRHLTPCDIHVFPSHGPLPSRALACRCACGAGTCPAATWCESVPIAYPSLLARWPCFFVQELSVALRHVPLSKRHAAANARVINQGKS